jgi:PST family polysaccharide transporter
MSLSVLQAANYVLPLLTLPYLIRVLGADKFGLLAFATAIITYFSILTDYGFNLSATREVSIHRQQKEELNAVFSAVMTLKMVLLLGGFVLMTLIVFANSKFTAHWPVFFLTFGTVLGQALFPVWFFQGMEQMKYVTYLNIAAKSAFTVLVFVLVRRDSDYLIVPALTSAGGIIAGAWSLYIVGKKFDVRFRWQSRERLAAEMRKGWHIFVATSFGSLYRESNTVILGFMGSSAIVGYYAIAEKIVKAIQSVQTPVGQALFPHLARKQGSNVLRDYVIKHWKAVTAAYGMLWLAVFACSELIVHRLAGAADARVLVDFRILSPIIFVGGLNFYFGVLGLLSTGRSKAFSAAVGVAGGFNVFACLFLSYLFKDAGAACAVLASELVLLVLIVRNVRRESRSDLAA